MFCTPAAFVYRQEVLWEVYVSCGVQPLLNTTEHLIHNVIRLSEEVFGLGFNLKDVVMF